MSLHDHDRAFHALLLMSQTEVMPPIPEEKSEKLTKGSSLGSSAGFDTHLDMISYDI